MEDLETVRAWTDDQLFGAMYQIDPGSKRYGILQTEANRRALLVGRRTADAGEQTARSTKLNAWFTFGVLLATTAAAFAALVAVCR